MRHEHASTPVTALSFVPEFHGRLLLAGEGPRLRVIDTRNESILIEKQVFRAQAIHGVEARWQFDPQNNRNAQILVLIWGGHSVRFVQLDYVENACAVTLNWSSSTVEALASDWILAATFRSEGTERAENACSAILVTAHNALLHAYVEGGLYLQDEKLPVISHIASGSRSILYSAHVLFFSASHIVIASGTVFGDILVWSCFVDGKVRPVALPQLDYVFRGHEGSIFGVHISHELSHLGGDAPRRLLASCSDDRTIRVWNISECCALTPNRERQINDASHDECETGFGRDIPDDISGAEHCGAVAWGHASRIWGALFVDIDDPSQTAFGIARIISFGEDATCQQWTLTSRPDEAATNKKNQKPKPEFPYALTNVESSNLHSGKNIWSMSLSRDQHGDLALATGGADGRVVFRTLQPCLGSQGLKKPHSESWGADDFLKSATAPNNSEDKEFVERATEENKVRKQGAVARDVFKCYAFLDSNKFIASTSQGTVFLATARILSEGQTIKRALLREKLAQFDDLRSYSVMGAPPNSGLAFIGGATGLVRYYDNRSKTLGDLTDVGGKIAGLFTHEISANEFWLVITCLGSFMAYSVRVRRQEAGESIPAVAATETKRLELPKGFVVTSVRSLVNRGLLVVGSRNGELLVYPLSEVNSVSDQQATLTPFSSSRVKIATDAITVITGLPQSSNTQNTEYILTAGRDGKYSIHELNIIKSDDGGIDAQWSTVHVATPPFGPNIEGAYFNSKDELVLYGFRSIYFVVWNETTQSELMIVECGGAHRSWAFSKLDADPNSECALVWTKASELQMRLQCGPSHQVLQNGAHGREIKSLAISPAKNQSGKCGGIVATGAEDTTIRLFLRKPVSDPNTGAGGYRCGALLKKHKTGIQHLKWSEDGSYLFSSGGFEEFFIWRVREIPSIGIGVVCEAICQSPSASHELRITGFDISEVRKATSRDDAQESGFLITLVYSDSTIRTYRYWTGDPEKKVELLLTGTYKTSCLTQAYHLIGKDSFHLITAGTDGYLGFWDLGTPLRDLGIVVSEGKLTSSQSSLEDRTASCTASAKVHQSTIKCFTAHEINDETLLVGTGGDDNSVAFTLVRHQQGKSSCSPLLVPNAHTAAVTALASIVDVNFKDPAGRRRFIFFSSSNDQRLKAWSLVVGEESNGVEGMEVKLLANEFTPIADVSSIDVVQEDGEPIRVMVCGVGMDVWTIPENT
ncbi:WD40 repeat-like protein [Xylona heveae TC161]|uniref:WD40 repeat-like protein n=1 Tax=Xylona heveae (strain CBS 132557 / TC161) TaxID=1328760 RepID=A0A165I0B9_XYLHT|nr:WD40 repeat-like protein [Xylona heveae TC161]KZF24178.1 WD40 repeat-like protein [Xylona heveae TC161]